VTLSEFRLHALTQIWFCYYRQRSVFENHQDGRGVKTVRAQHSSDYKSKTAERDVVEAGTSAVNGFRLRHVCFRFSGCWKCSGLLGFCRAKHL